MKLWTIHVEIGVSESIGSDVPNLMKDVPNLMKDVPNFAKDVPNFVKDVPNFGKDVPRFQSAFQGGDRPPITLLWVSK